jgi:hypothetical protein
MKEPREMHDQTLASMAQQIHLNSVELAAFFADLDKDDLPQALCQHLRRALGRINGEVTSVLEDVGAGPPKLLRQPPRSC